MGCIGEKYLFYEWGDWYEKRRDDLFSKLSTLDSFARHYNPVFDVAPYLSHSLYSWGEITISTGRLVCTYLSYDP